MEGPNSLPYYDGLPHAPGIELGGCAWDIFDHDGKKDELGTLNLLTPARILKAAREEIQFGESVSLNLGLESIRFPSFGRQAFQHKVIDLAQLGYAGFDEEISLNPQVTSHWNSFLHFAHQPSKTYYNGLKHGDFASRTDLRNGIHNASQQGISGRGVLLDWYSWGIRNGRTFRPDERREIHPAELDEVAAEQNVCWEVGDILLVRTGFLHWYKKASVEEQKAGTADASKFLGLLADVDSFRWHWDHHFAAVAADNMTYEAWPPNSPMLHEYLLTMSGTMIGKLLDLEELSRVCQEKQRWTFFFTSSPMNVAHGISSLANALAFF